VLADTTQLGRLFRVFTALFKKKQTFVDRILHDTS